MTLRAMPEKKLELGRGTMDGGREGTAQCVLKGRHAVLVPAFGTSEKQKSPHPWGSSGFDSALPL